MRPPYKGKARGGTWQAAIGILGSRHMNVLEDKMSYRSGDVQCELEQRQREVSRETAARKGEWLGGQACVSDSPCQTELWASFFLWWK